MAPKYNPMQALAPTGIIAQDFNIQAQDFTDAEKIQAMLRAQELSNQQNEIAVQNNQQKFDNQNQLRDALKEQYGSLPEGEQFDPSAALDKAREIAFGQGDLDTALNIERAQKERRGGAIPLSENQRQFYGNALPGQEIPEGITAQDMNIYGALQRGNVYEQSARETADKRSDNLQSLAPGGFEAVIGENGQGPTPVDGKLFTATVRAHSRINSDLDSLEELLGRGGANDPTSVEFQRGKALLGDIQIALKEKNGFGAALAGNEERLNNSGLPVVMAREDVGLGDALVAAGLGRDPVDAIKTMRGMLSSDFDNQATIYKFRPVGGTSLPAAQSGTSFRIPGGLSPEITNALSAAGAGGAPPPLSNYGVPRNKDGSVLSREQFMKLHSGGN